MLDSRNALLEGTFSVSRREFQGNALGLYNSSIDSMSCSPDQREKRMEKEALEYINSHRDKNSPMLPLLKKKLTVHEMHKTPVKRRNKGLIF